MGLWYRLKLGKADTVPEALTVKLSHYCLSSELAKATSQAHPALASTALALVQITHQQPKQSTSKKRQ